MRAGLVFVAGVYKTGAGDLMIVKKDAFFEFKGIIKAIYGKQEMAAQVGHGIFQRIYRYNSYLVLRKRVFFYNKVVYGNIIAFNGSKTPCGYDQAEQQ